MPCVHCKIAGPASAGPVLICEKGDRIAQGRSGDTSLAGRLLVNVFINIVGRHFRSLSIRSTMHSSRLVDTAELPFALYQAPGACRHAR